MTARAIQTPTATVIPTTPAPVCQGQSVVLTATDAPAGQTYAYQWRNNGTDILNATGRTYTANVTGSYSVIITNTTGGANCPSAPSAAVPVTVTTPPTVSVVASQPNICAGQSTTLTASGATSYTWSPATGLSNTTGATVTANPTTTTTYTVTAVSGGCTVTSQVTVNVNPRPSVPSVSGTATLICESGSTVLTVTGAPAGGGYQWYTGPTGNNAITGATGSSYTTPNISTTTRYYVATVSPQGCESATRTEVIARVVPRPVATITPAGPVSVCAGTPATLTAPSPPTGKTYSYQWYRNGEAISNATSISYSTTEAGSYQLVITDPAENCPSNLSTPVTVRINALPDAPSTTSEARCGSGTITLTASGAPSGGSYRWYTASSGGSAISGQTDGTYSPSLSANTTFYVSTVSAEGCESATRTPVTATINTIPLVSISAATATSFCNGSSVVLSSSVAPATPANGGSYSYQWYEQTGGEIAGANQSTFTANASGRYFLVVTNSSGTCQSVNSNFITVTVNPIPATPVVNGPFERCGNGTVTLSGTAGANGNTLRWYSAESGGSILREGLTFTTPVLNADTEYYVSTYNTTTRCESDRILVNVIVKPLPDVTITPTGPTSFCIGNSVLLVAVDNEAYSYQWYKGIPNGVNSPITGATGSTYEVEEVGTNNFYAVITRDGCSVASNVIAVTVSERPNSAAISIVGATTFCNTGSVRLEAPAGTGYSYAWQIKDGTTYLPAVGKDGANNNTRVFVADKSGTYRVVVTKTTNGVSCDKESDEVTVTVLPQPTASIAPPTIVQQCEQRNGATTYTVVGTYSNGTGVWSSSDSRFTISDINESTNAEGVTTSTITVTAPASVTSELSTTIRLNVTENIASCNPASATVNLTVWPLPVATISTSGTTTFCAGGSVTLTASNGSSYLWSNGATTQSIIVNASGNYSVTVFSSRGCETTSAPVAVTVNPMPEATIMVDGDLTFCQGGSVILSAPEAPAGSTYAYQWLNGTTEITANGNGRTFTATVSGNYRVRVTDTSKPTSCSVTTSEPTIVTVNTRPTASISANGAPTTFCQGGSVTLTATATPSAPASPGTYTYQWYNASGIIDGAINRTYATTESGAYYVIITNSAGACSSAQSNTINVTVNTVPKATIATTSPTTFCEGGSVVLTAVADPTMPASGNYSYVWRRGGTVIPEATGLTYKAETAGSYTVTIINPESSGSCESTTSAAVTVTVNTRPKATIAAASATTFCNGGSVVLTATAEPATPVGTGSYTYQWFNSTSPTPNTPVGSARTYTATTSGSYYVVITNTAGGCAGAPSGSIPVTVNPIPVANAGGDKTMCSGESVILGVAPVAGYTYSWAPSTGLSANNVAQPTLTISNTGSNNITTTYTLTVLQNGCSSTSSATITVRPTLTNNTISSAHTICENATPQTLTGSIPSGGGGAGSYSYQWQSSTGGSAYANIQGATAQNYSPGPLTATTSFRRIVRSAACASTTENISTPVTITVTPTARLVLILTASPFPVCPGQNTTYTARVIQNPTKVNYPDNPRFEQVTWVGGTDVTDLFLFDWWKNNTVDNQEGQTGPTVSQAGLSSKDFFTVRAKPKNPITIPCYVYDNKPEMVVNDNKGNVLFSNRIYLGMPENYEVSITANPTGPICPGTPVTFTATPAVNAIVSSTLMLNWRVNERIVSSVLYSTSNQFTANNLKNGDKVDLTFTSQENKCSPVASNNSITMVVALEQTLAGGGAICQGATGVPITLSGSQSGITYTLKRNGTETVETRTGNGSAITFSRQTTTGVYTVEISTGVGLCFTTNAVRVDVTQPPTTQTLTVGNNGEFCAGGAGVPITLSSSQTGVSYQLRRTFDGTTTNVGLPINGSDGQSISFGAHTDEGVYSVVATTIAGSTVAACTTTMGSVTVQVNPLPLTQTFTGGGSYCAGGAGAPVGLQSSQSGVTYNLRNSKGEIVGTVEGTGSAISFGNFKADTYTVQALNGATNCSITISGSIQILETALPTEYAVTGGGSACAGGAGVIVGLGNSQTGVLYQLRRRAVDGTVTDVGSPVGGTTGSSISFGNQTVAGIYSVIATTISTPACPLPMLGEVPVTINPLPQLRTVSGPPFCPVTQPDGTLITLANSESGVTYTLTKVGDPSFTPVTRTGTGSSTEPLSFGTFTPGTYSVSGTNSSSCSTPKVGEVTVTAVTYPIVAGELEVFWRDNTTNWEVVAKSDHITKGVAMNDNFVYEWYVGASESSATLYTTTRYPDNSIMINNPAEGLFVRCIIRTPSGICLPDVIMDNRGIIPLPVELIYFKGVRKDNTVVLTWATASEKENAGFELQVSQDNKNYRQLEFVPSKNGTSSLKQLYEFVDRENGKFGTRYYRLKQLDLDGQFSYYGPVAVAFGEASNKAMVYPNPFEREVKLEIDAEKATVMELAVTNLQGRQLMIKNVKVEQGKNTITLDLGPDLPAGMYIITTRFNGTFNNFKLLKQ
ncbi:Ig-like domain-containing protein [Pontibacter burrus]|uniref:T9SS type A sorting domain-containing protein n=1 Tax=Pontibacter burrus TaxID=2704466 RepID=A0A6B3LXA1_9BACT|nr:T9SS type A sorting domain-containing protein [Pontibacter burrus]NEM98054.1 T9SS type A sorting domain-containing protein [Pontibacter burrus]